MPGSLLLALSPHPTRGQHSARSSSRSVRPRSGCTSKPFKIGNALTCLSGLPAMCTSNECSLRSPVSQSPESVQHLG